MKDAVQPDTGLCWLVREVDCVCGGGGGDGGDGGEKSDPGMENTKLKSTVYLFDQGHRCNLKQPNQNHCCFFKTSYVSRFKCSKSLGPPIFKCYRERLVSRPIKHFSIGFF